MLINVDIRRGDVYTVEVDAAACGFFQTVQTTQECGLTGTGGAHDNNHVTTADVQIDTMLNLLFSESLLQVFDMNQNIVISGHS